MPSKTSDSRSDSLDAGLFDCRQVVVVYFTHTRARAHTHTHLYICAHTYTLLFIFYLTYHPIRNDVYSINVFTI